MTAVKGFFAALFMTGLLALGAAPAYADGARADQLIAKGVGQLSDDADAARKTFELAIVADPKSSMAFAYLGQAHMALDHLKAARKYFAISLELDPDNLDALGWAGVADLKARNIRAAEARLGRLLRLCDGKCAAYDLLTNAMADYEAKK